MLSNDILNLFWYIHCSCNLCIRANRYSNVLYGSKKDVLKYTHNFYVSMCIIHWCQVFGGNREPIRYTKLFTSNSISCISKKEVLNRLRSSVNMNITQYNIFHNTIKKARDKFIVHFEFDSEESQTCPDHDKMADICFEMRKILSEIISSEQSENIEYHDKLKRYFSYHTNDKLKNKIYKEVTFLKKSLLSEPQITMMK